MSKREWILWILGAGVLAVLFLASSTDWIIKEKEMEVYPVSVIVSDDRDDNYINFKKGMDQAAMEFNVDVSFITLYSSNEESEQLELIRREVKDGAGAIVLAPVCEDSTVEALGDMDSACPVILLGSQNTGSPVTDVMTPDWYAMGVQLGQGIAEDVSNEVPICLISEGLEFTGNRGMYEGVCSVLEERGYETRLFEKKTKDTYWRTVEDVVSSGGDSVIIVALDAQALYETSQILKDSSIYANRVAGLYGVGSTTAILYELDHRVIDGIVFYDRYTEGYRSIEQAVAAIKGKREKSQTVFETYYLEPERLRDPAFEKMLYPIE